MKKCFRKALDRLLDNDLNVSTVATDRHTGIKAIMRKFCSKTDHQFDVFQQYQGETERAYQEKEACRLAPWVWSI